MCSIASIKDCLIPGVNSAPLKGQLLVVYLFGSFARDQERTKSDIDLAFLVDQAKYQMDAFEATAPVHMIAAKVGMKLDRAVDVTILNSASLEIAHEIITTGRLLFESDVELRLQYEIKITGMYFDFQPFLAELRTRKLAKLGPMMVSQ